MPDRWLYLRGGDAALLVDTRPSGDALPRVIHFGADLGAAPDYDAIASAAPNVLWGARLDVPITHINASYVRSHFDAMEVGVPGHPRADELVFVLVMTTGARIHERVGGLKPSEISVGDGQR